MSAAKTAGNIMTAVGSLMILSALGLMLFNIRTSDKAGNVSHDTVQSFIEYIEEIKNEENEQLSDVQGIYTGDTVHTESINEESYFEKDEIRFSAILTVPATETELPVCSSFSMEQLRNYPCIYSGSFSENNLIIAAHNYDSHFGRLKSLQTGDEAVLTDALGNTVVYTVTETEVLPGAAVTDMKSGSWDLTLFTCDLSGKNRITVRLIRKY